MVGWMPYLSQRSETGVCSRRWSRRMAAFSWALGRFRVFLGMGEPPLEIVAYSSGPFFPFRLKQNRPGASQRDPPEIHGIPTMLAGVDAHTTKPVFDTESVSLNLKWIWTVSLVAALGGLLFGYDWVV